MITTTCEYTDPLVLDSSGDLVVPTSGDSEFSFSKSECITDYEQVESSASAVVSLDPTSDFYTGFSDFTNIIFLVSFLVVFTFGFYISSVFFKR